MDPSAWGWSYPPGPGGPPPPLPPTNANPPLPPDQPLPPLPVTGDVANDTKKSIPDLTANPPPSNSFYGAATDWQQNYGNWNQNAYPSWGGPASNNWPGYGPSPWNNAPPPTGQDPNSYAWNQYWNNTSQAPPQVPLQAPPQVPPPPGPPPGKDSNTNKNDETEFDESKDPELIEFDAQFKTWEQQFEKWREDNKDHPDKSALTKYEETWTKWRDELLTKRKEIKKTKLEQFKSSNTTAPKGQKTETTAVTNEQPQWGQNAPNQVWGSTDTSQQPWGHNANQPWGPVSGGPWGPTGSNLPGLGPPPDNLNQAPPGYNAPNWSSSGPNQSWGPSGPNQGQGWGPNVPNQGWGANGPPGQAPAWGPNGPVQGWGPNGPNQSGPNQAAPNSVGPNQGGPNIGQTWGPGGPPPGNENMGPNQSWGPGGPNQVVGWGPPGSNRPPNQGQNWGPNASNQGPNCGPNGPNQGPNWGQNSSNWSSNGPNGSNQGSFGPNQGPNGPNQGPNGPNQGSNGPNQGSNSSNQGQNWNSGGTNQGPNWGPNRGSNGPNHSSQSEPPKGASGGDSPNQGSRPSPSEGNDGPTKASISGPPGMTQTTGWGGPSGEKLNSGPSSMPNWGSSQGNNNWGASKDDCGKNWIPASGSSNRPSSGSDSGRDIDSKPNQRQSKWDNGPPGFKEGPDPIKGPPGFNQGDGPNQGNRFNQGRGPGPNQGFNSNQDNDSEWSTDTFKAMDSGKDSGWMGNRGPNRSNNEPQWSGSHRGPGSGFGNRNFSEDESDMDGPNKEGPWNFNKQGDKGRGFGSSDGRFSPGEDDHRNSGWQSNQRFGGPNMGQPPNQNFNRNFDHGLRGGPPSNFNRSSNQEPNPDFGRMNKRPNMDFQRGNSYDGSDMDAPRRRRPSNHDQDSMMGGRNMQGFGFNSGPDDNRQDHSWGGPNQGRSLKGAPNQSRQLGRSSLLPNPKTGNFMQNSPPLLPNMDQRGLMRNPLSSEQPKSLMDIPSLLPTPDSKGLLPMPDSVRNKGPGHRWSNNDSLPLGPDFRGKGKGGAQSNIKDKGRFSNASKGDGEPAWNASRKNDNVGSSTHSLTKREPIKKDTKAVGSSKPQPSKPNTTVGKNDASKDSTEHKKELPIPTPKDILLSTQNIDPATAGTPKAASKVVPSTHKGTSLLTPKSESTKSSKDNVTTIASEDKSSQVNKSASKVVSNSTAKSATGKADSESGALKSDAGTSSKSPLKSADDKKLATSDAAQKEKPISTQAQARATGNILALFRQRAQEKASGKGAQEGPHGIPGLDLPKEEKESKETVRDSQSSRGGGKFSSRKQSNKNNLPGKDGTIDVKFGENRLNIGPIGVNPNPKTWKPPGEWYDDDEENEFSNATEGERHGYRKNYGKRSMDDGGSGNSSSKMPRFSDGPGMLPLPVQFAMSQGAFGGPIGQIGGPQNFGISQGLLRGPQAGRRQSFLGPRDFGDPGGQRGSPRGGFAGGGGPEDQFDMVNRGGNMGNRSRGSPRDGSRGRGGGRGPEALLDMDFASDASFDRNSFFEVGPLGRGINKNSSHERLPFFESEASDANYFGSFNYHKETSEQLSSKDLPVVKVVDYGHGSISKAVTLDANPNEKYIDFGCTNAERQDNIYSPHSETKDSSKEKVEPAKSQDVQKADVVPQTISINDLISVPGRFMRPPKLVVILRGLPGSGKTTIAKMIKNKEIENGGSAPRILCLDDYFMVESEKLVKDPETGRTVKTKVMEYEFEPELEENYRAALVRSFKKQIDEGFFPFIIIDCVNACVKDYREIGDYAKKNDFEVYIGEVEVEVQTCFQRNVHCRSLKDLQKTFLTWEKSPVEFFIVDLTDYIQDANIQEVKMEDCIEEVKGEVKMDIVDSNEEEEYDKEAETFKVIKELMKSKWDTDQTQGDTLDKLDGVRSAKKRMGEAQPQSIDDWLQLSESFKETKAKPGKKTVRWADIEERREQLSARNRGFVVGQTDWQRMTDPHLGSNALVQIRYIEPREN